MICLRCFHWNFSWWSAKWIKKKLWRYTVLVWFINCAHSKWLFLVTRVYSANYHSMVSSVQVEMYHIQLEIWLLLLLMDLHNFTQEATQATCWCTHQFRAACTGYCQSVWYRNAKSSICRHHFDNQRAKICSIKMQINRGQGNHYKCIPSDKTIEWVIFSVSSRNPLYRWIEGQKGE